MNHSNVSAQFIKYKFYRVDGKKIILHLTLLQLNKLFLVKGLIDFTYPSQTYTNVNRSVVRFYSDDSAFCDAYRRSSFRLLLLFSGRLSYPYCSPNLWLDNNSICKNRPLKMSKNVLYSIPRSDFFRTQPNLTTVTSGRVLQNRHWRIFGRKMIFCLAAERYVLYKRSVKLLKFIVFRSTFQNTFLKEYLTKPLSTTLRV